MLYRILDAQGAGFIIIASLLPFLTVGRGTFAVVAGWIGASVFYLAATWVYLRDARWVSEKWRRTIDGWHLAAFLPGSLVLAWAGFVVVSLGSIVEALQRIEAGIAFLGVACIPALFLAALQILRWVMFDQSPELMAQLNLDARLHDWEAAKIEDAYFRIERARARNPVRESLFDD